MNHRTIPGTGLKVSELGLGCNNFGWKLDQAGTTEVVRAALEAGISFYDTADIYDRGNSEIMLGKALEGSRQSVIIASKFGGSMGEGPNDKGAGRKHIIEACEASLMRLNTDYLDLYQLHFPDDSTPLEETIRALDDLQRAGKIRYFGHSNFEAWRVVEADWIAREIGSSRFVTAQNQYSLLERLPEKELIPVLEKKTIGLLPYFPLASGLLTGKYRRGESAPQDSRAVVWKREERMLTPENFDRLDALTDFADEHGMSILDLAFAYLLSQPLVPSVIAGATSREQITANAAACERRLSQSDLEDLEKLLEAL